MSAAKVIQNVNNLVLGLRWKFMQQMMADTNPDCASKKSFLESV